MTLRDSHPVLAEAMTFLHGSGPVDLCEDFRFRLEHALKVRPAEQRQAGIRNVVRLARHLEHDLRSPEAARKLLNALADLSFTDADLRAALKEAGDRLSAAVEKGSAGATGPITLRANQFAIPMRG